MATGRRRLSSLRKAQGFTQESFAEEIGVDRRSVQRWEKGEADPQPWLRPRVANALDIGARELDELLSSDATPPRLKVPCETKRTFAAIDRVDRMAESLEMREDPQHHYQYDPAKALSYKATTLAWLGEPSAEVHAREVIARLNPSGDVAKWPRRVASAKIDLALALLAVDRLDEACDVAQQAILSGGVVPSNHWRALEVVSRVERRQLPEATDLREAFEGMKSVEGSTEI